MFSRSSERKLVWHAVWAGRAPSSPVPVEPGTSSPGEGNAPCSQLDRTLSSSPESCEKVSSGSRGAVGMSKTEKVQVKWLPIFERFAGPDRLKVMIINLNHLLRCLFF